MLQQRRTEIQSTLGYIRRRPGGCSEPYGLGLADIDDLSEGWRTPTKPDRIRTEKKLPPSTRQVVRI